MDELAAFLGDILDAEAHRFRASDRMSDALRSQTGIDCESDASIRPRTVVLAVSGGADSLALLIAASVFVRRRANPPFFHVVTVDHRLRSEAAAEALHVEACAARFGLSVETCRWTDAELVRGNIAAAARNARYDLLSETAERCGASLILTAHHQDDQIETHLMAAARGAGPFGLAAMRPLTELSPRLRLGRPFLAIPGETLKACVAGTGLSAVDDPTNRAMTSERIRLRFALRSGELSRRDHLEALAAQCVERTRGETVLAQAISRLEASGALRFSDDGAATLSNGELQSLDRECAFHVLRRLLTAVGGAESAPGGQATTRLLDRLRDEADAGLAATLGGARLAAGPGSSASDAIVLCREYGRSGPPGVTVVPSRRLPLVFDRRFDVTLPCDPMPPGARVVPFGSFGRGNPFERTLPVLADSNEILAAPGALARHVTPGTSQLGLDSRVRWRSMADLTGEDGASLAVDPSVVGAEFTLRAVRRSKLPQNRRPVLARGVSTPIFDKIV